MSAIPSLRERLRECTSLPSLPAAALAVLQLTQDPSAEMDDLADTIAKDPALSVKLLRTVNSSLFGLQQKVSSLQQAVTLLGIHSVKTLVLGFSLVQNVKGGGSKGFDHVGYWRRSMYAAAAARTIAARILPTRVEDCFVSALLMDLGTLVLDQLLGEEYGQLYSRAKTHPDLLILETHALGMTHAEVGGSLAEFWKLPDVLRVAIAAHHGPQAVEDPALRRVTEVVCLAGRCADVFVNASPAETISTVRRAFLEMYRITEIQSDAILVEIGQKTSKLAPLFEVKLGANGDYESILASASQRLLEISLAERGEQGGNGAEGGGVVNRRRAPRIRRDGKLLVTPCAHGILGVPLTVRLKDLSASGIGFIYTESMPKGMQFVVQLPQPNGTPKSLLYTVVRNNACSSAGLFEIGAELSTVLRPERASNPPSTGVAVAAH